MGIADSDVPIIGQPLDKPEFELPHFDDRVRFLGEATEEVLLPLDYIRLGLTDISRVEYYLGGRKGTYYVRFLPHHSFIEIGWKNTIKEGQKNRSEGDAPALPGGTSTHEPIPNKCIWTDKGMMYDISMYSDGQYERIYEALQEDVLSKIDIFASSTKRREEDPWT